MLYLKNLLKKFFYNFCQLINMYIFAQEINIYDNYICKYNSHSRGARRIAGGVRMVYTAK